MVVVEICWRLLNFLVVVVLLPLGVRRAEEEAAAAAFLSLRSVAAEARIAGWSSGPSRGRMWSLTLLKRKV
jgi:hypothetical protein